MPTKREREYYAMGFSDAMRMAYKDTSRVGSFMEAMEPQFTGPRMERTVGGKFKPKRKLSAWNKFVKANSRKKEFRYANGKLKLKKMGIAFRKKRRR